MLIYAKWGWKMIIFDMEDPWGNPKKMIKNWQIHLVLGRKHRQVVFQLATKFLVGIYENY